MVGIVYTLQILASFLVYKLYMSRLKTFNVNYKNTKYLRNFAFLFSIYLILVVFFRIVLGIILSSFAVFLAYYYLKKYYKNTILTTEDYVYNGVALLRKSGVEEAFIEHGRNLEKKYKVKYLGLEKYKSADYIVLKTAKSNYVLIKNYDVEYLNVMQTLFDITININQ